MVDVRRKQKDWFDICFTILFLLLAALVLAAGIYKEWLQFQVMIKYLKGG